MQSRRDPYLEAFDLSKKLKIKFYRILRKSEIYPGCHKTNRFKAFRRVNDDLITFEAKTATEAIRMVANELKLRGIA